MIRKEFIVDLNKPLVSQVGHLGESYEEWVHEPIISKEGPRFFENEVMEFLSRTVWWAVPVIWLPVVCWFITMSIHMGHSLSQVALIIITGIFIWTFIEYLMHRFLFHFKTNGYWSNTIHYLFHGFHHKHPMDNKRLVFPPAATAIFCILGYVMYDCTHYYLHHGQPSKGSVRNLKRYHLNHHFKIQNKGYGVTSSLWDNVFGTSPPTPKCVGKRS